MTRWNNFLSEGLSRYHRTRNNAAKRGGVSGMSPWLHHGMIAATRLVRDAAQILPLKALKNSLMRCWFSESTHIIMPTRLTIHWNGATCQDGLENHGKIHAWSKYPLLWMDLERGNTDDPLWNAAQTGIVRHGVMHNNVRMTWGKGTVRWVDDPEEAMSFTQELNDRYALDGRNPNSIAGVMWCYGLFDRPFDPQESEWGGSDDEISKIMQHTRHEGI